MSLFRRVRILAAVLAVFAPFALHAQTTTGYKSNGTDLGSIFAPYHSGWPKAAPTGYYVNGVDLDDIFAPLSTGSAAGPTGYKLSNGADLNTVFAALGSTGVQVGAQPSAVSGSAAAGNPSGPVTSNTTTVAGTKGGGSYSYAWHLSGSASLTAPSSATTGVTDGSVPAATTLSGTMYCTISDGVTAVNTNTVGWSLTNTTPASQNFTMTAVTWTNTGGTHIGANVSGGHGSITNATLPSGGTINALVDNSAGNTSFGISGLTSDPGQGYFSSIVSDGQTRTSSSATYAYSAGTATWTWPGTTIGFVSGDSYPSTINF